MRQWSVGAVLHDWDGNFVAVGPVGFFSDILVAEAETQTMFYGMRIAADLGLSSVEVEKDCQYWLIC